MLRRVFSPLLWPDFIFYLTSDGRQFKSDLKVINDFSDHIIKMRKIDVGFEEFGGQRSSRSEGQVSRKKMAFLDLLLDIHSKDPGKMTYEEIEWEVNTFIAAGHDSIATTLSFAMHSLGLYSDIQEKAFREVMDVTDGTRIVPENLPGLKYLEMIIKETLRLFPILTAIGRKIGKGGLRVGKYFLPQGTETFIWIHGAHRDPKLFPDPEKFIPERFEDPSHLPPHAYIPFSGGPRNCIGQKLAMMQLKTALARILQKYRITSLDSTDRLNIKPLFVIKAFNPIRVILERR